MAPRKAETLFKLVAMKSLYRVSPNCSPSDFSFTQNTKDKFELVLIIDPELRTVYCTARRSVKESNHIDPLNTRISATETIQNATVLGHIEPCTSTQQTYILHSELLQNHQIPDLLHVTAGGRHDSFFFFGKRCAPVQVPSPSPPTSASVQSDIYATTLQTKLSKFQIKILNIYFQPFFFCSQFFCFHIFLHSKFVFLVSKPFFFSNSFFFLL